ncbi:MAG: phosphotransferase family protein [Myxococcota bacterium]
MPLSVPVTLEDLTADWLSTALGTRFPGCRVRDVRVLDRHDGTTGRARLGLAYDDACGAPASVFVKLPPSDEGQRALVASTGMGRREARYYAELAGAAPVRVPACHHAASDEEGARYVMLLEDLEAAGCTFPGPDAPDAAQRARRVVTGHARLHAAFWESERFAGDLAWVEPPMRHEIGALLVQQSLAQFADTMPKAFAEIGALYVENHEAVCDLWEEGESTLVHGDSHLGNLFQDGDEVGFLDWAVLSRAPGIRDVAYYLSNSMPTDLRRAEERALLDLYREQLLAAGAPAPDADTLWRRYRRHVAYSWVAAATTAAMGEKWQPLSVTRPSLERTTAAVADLGTVDLFREELGL